MRFAFHRPAQCDHVSARCHRSSTGGPAPCDVACRVHIRVVPMPALDATESRLALTRVRCDMQASVAGLRRERGIDLLDPAGSLLLQAGRQHCPPGGGDAPVEPGLGPDIPSGLVDGSAGRPGHGFDGEVLDADHVETAGEIGAGLLDPVFTPVSVPGFPPGDGRLDLPAAVRPALSAGQPALQPQRAAPLPSGEARRGSSSPRWTGRRRRSRPRSTPTTSPVPGAGSGRGSRRTRGASAQRGPG